MVNKTIFVDVNYFCALYNPKDTLHKNSRKLSEKIKVSGNELIISNYIICEALTVLSQRVAKKAALLFWKNLERGKIRIIWIDSKLQLQSFQIFKKIKSKNVSFVDASNLAIIKKFKIDYLLTFDKKLIRTAKEFGINVF